MNSRSSTDIYKPELFTYIEVFAKILLSLSAEAISVSSSTERGIIDWVGISFLV